MKKVIFVDVDGTLVDYENHLPESAKKAIRKARENGHRVYICTGRSKAEVYNNIWEIGLDGMIGGNGSYVEDDGQVLMHQMLTKEECRQIVDWLHERKLEFYLESNSGLYASEEFEKAAQGSMQEYSRRKGREAPLSIRDAFPEMIFGADLYREDVNKISYLLNSYQDFLETKARFPELQNGTWGGAGETALFGDLGVKEITKACAIETLLKHLNQKQENTIAVGDAKIDIPMLEYCNIGVAMGNGGEEIKKMADYITDDVEKDGLWNAFRHFELI